ncbi:hypothetical protein LguiB_004751 [Lonicera macranthoides]
MDHQDIINLFDFYWFNLEIFNKPSHSSISSSFETNPYQEIQENPLKNSDPMISRLPSILVRSKSDQISSTASLFSDSNSPNSVLFTPHLQTILSGKESTQEELKQIEEHKPVIKTSNKGIRGRKKMGSSKSLSELEVEELKGFMDLGFVFSEEDKKDSSLVEIIPGLQRLGKKEDSSVSDFDESSSCSSVSRPYLSEAWEVLDRRNKETPLMDWIIPAALNNDVDIKNSLKLWAHNVATTVIR